MKTFQKFLCIFCTLGIISSMTVPAFAATSTNIDNPIIDSMSNTSPSIAPKEVILPSDVSTRNLQNFNDNQESEIIITDSTAIDEYVRLNNVKIPDGATLTQVIITNSSNISDEYSVPPTTRATGINIRNVKLSTADYVYADDVEWDKVTNYAYSGIPDKYDTTYSQTKVSSWNVGVKASGKIKIVELEAAVGFTMSDSITKTKHFATTIPFRTRIEVKVQMNYTMKTYDIYNGDTYLDSGKAWKPKGLIVEKFEYKI